MELKLLKENIDAKEFIKEVENIYNLPNVNGIFVLATDACNLDYNYFSELVKKKIQIFGGVFPQIILGNEYYEKAILIVGIEELPKIQIIKDISQENIEIEDLLDPNILTDGNKTMMVFIDAFSSRINYFIESLFNVYGIEINIIGGGAGSLDMTQKPCVITPEGLLKDAAVLISLMTDSGIGVNHGWEQIAGPFKVSKAEKNVLHMLDNKTAFQVYKEVVELDSNRKFTDNNFFNISKAYPFGISRFDSEHIVRDPIIVNEDGSLICVGELDQNSFVYILKGDPKKLIEAASLAYKQAANNIPEHNENSCVFFIDCISRVLFLEDQFEEELAVVNKTDMPLFGALTLGEIANNGNSILEFYNKTAVVSIIDRL